MAKFENVQGITEIKINHSVQCYCPLGDDWYTNKILICMSGISTVPDYCDVDRFIRSISGGKLIIEDVVSKIYSYIMDECHPKKLSVSSHVDDAMHMPVSVIKSSE